MNTMQQERDERRAAYMAHETTHQEYYEWLSRRIGLNQDDLPVTLDRIRKSTDEHLNDIPLHLWDARDYTVRRKAILAGMNSWSLCDTVCCLKAVARAAIRD